MTDVYEFVADALDGTPRPLAEWRGQVLLIVNTASQCGFTPQYAALGELHRDYRDRGFAVLGFPCNQFGRQEPGDAAAIGAFCETRFAIRFPLFGKVEVNGGGAHPLYRYLTRAAPGVLGTTSVKWNFTKFLVGRDGRAVRRFAPRTRPDAIRPAIERLL